MARVDCQALPAQYLPQAEMGLLTLRLLKSLFVVAEVVEARTQRPVHLPGLMEVILAFLVLEIGCT